jgi:hypothetical protein
LEEKPITLYSGSVKPLRVLHHRWRVQRVLNGGRVRVGSGLGRADREWLVDVLKRWRDSEA